jgi:DNA-binding MarR family transcriptional regulator
VALEDSFARASRDLGMTAQQAELLCAAMSPGPIGDLAQVLRCDRSNVSRLVERARGRGWLDRRGGETDGRVSVIALTPEGEQLARRFIASLEEQLAPLLQAWPRDRNQGALEVLSDITDSLDAARDLNARRRPSPHQRADRR